MNTKEEMKNNIGIYSLRQANGHIIKKIKKIEKCRLSCLQLTLIIISTIILLGAIIATIIVIVNKRKKDEKESNNNIIIENNEQNIDNKDNSRNDQNDEDDTNRENNEKNNHGENSKINDDNKEYTLEEIKNAFEPNFKIKTSVGSLSQVLMKSDQRLITKSNNLEVRTFVKAKFDLYIISESPSETDEESYFYKKKYTSSLVINSLCVKSEGMECELIPYLDLTYRKEESNRNLNENEEKVNIEDLVLPICLIEHTETNIIISISCPKFLEDNLKDIIYKAFNHIKPVTINGFEEDKIYEDTSIETKENKKYINLYSQFCEDNEKNNNQNCQTIINIISDQDENYISYKKKSKIETDSILNEYEVNYEDITSQNSNDLNPSNYKSNLDLALNLVSKYMAKEIYVTENSFKELLEPTQDENISTSKRNLEEEIPVNPGSLEATIFSSNYNGINVYFNYSDNILNEDKSKTISKIGFGNNIMELSHNEVDSNLTKTINKFKTLSDAANSLGTDLYNKLNNPLIEIRDKINTDFTIIDNLLSFKDLSSVFDSTFAISGLNKFPYSIVPSSTNIYNNIKDLNDDLLYIINDCKKKLDNDVSSFLVNSHNLLYNIFNNLKELSLALSSTKSKIANIASYYELNYTNNSFITIINEATNILDNYYIDENNTISGPLNEWLNSFLINSTKLIQDSHYYFDNIIKRLEDEGVIINKGNEEDIRIVIKNLYNTKILENQILPKIVENMKNNIILSNGYLVSQEIIDDNKKSYIPISENALNIANNLLNNGYIDEEFDKIMSYFREQFIIILKKIEKSKIENFVLQVDALNLRDTFNDLDKVFENEKNNIYKLLYNNNNNFLNLINNEINSFINHNKTKLQDLINSIDNDLSKYNLSDINKTYNEMLNFTRDNISNIIDYNYNLLLEYISDVKSSTHRTQTMENKFNIYLNRINEIKSYIEYNLKNDLINKYKQVINQIRKNLQSIKSNSYIKQYSEINNLTFFKSHTDSINSLYLRLNEFISDELFNTNYMNDINIIIISFITKIDSQIQNFNNLYNPLLNLPFSQDVTNDIYYLTSWRCCKRKWYGKKKCSTCYGYTPSIVSKTNSHTYLKKVNFDDYSKGFVEKYTEIYNIFSNNINEYNNIVSIFGDNLQRIINNYSLGSINYLNNLSNEMKSFLNNQIGIDFMKVTYNHYKDEMKKKLPIELKSILEEWKSLYNKIYEEANNNINKFKYPIGELGIMAEIYYSYYYHKISNSFLDSVVEQRKTDFNFTIKYYYNLFLSKINKTYTYILNNIPINEKPFNNVLDYQISQIKQSHDEILNLTLISLNDMLNLEKQLKTFKVSNTNFFEVNSYSVDILYQIENQLLPLNDKLDEIKERAPNIFDSEESVSSRYYLENLENGKQINEIYDTINKGTFIDFQNENYLNLFENILEIDVKGIINKIFEFFTKSNEKLKNDFEIKKKYYKSILQDELFNQLYNKENLEKKIDLLYSEGLNDLNNNQKDIIMSYIDEIIEKIGENMKSEQSRLLNKLTSYSNNYNKINNTLNEFKKKIYSDFYNVISSNINDFYSQIIIKFYNNYIVKSLEEYNNKIKYDNFTQHNFLNISFNLKQVVHEEIEILVNEYKRWAMNEIDFLRMKKVQQLNDLFSFSNLEKNINNTIDSLYNNSLYQALKKKAIYTQGEEGISDYDFSLNILASINKIIDQKINETKAIIGEKYNIKEDWKRPDFSKVKINIIDIIKEDFISLFVNTHDYIEKINLNNEITKILQKNYEKIIGNFVPSFSKDYFERILKYNENQKIKSLYDNLKNSLGITLKYYIFLSLGSNSISSMPNDLLIKIISLNDINSIVNSKINLVLSNLNSKFADFLSLTKNKLIEKYNLYINKLLAVDNSLDERTRNLTGVILNNQSDTLNNIYINMMNKYIKNPFIEQYTNIIKKETNDMLNFIGENTNILKLNLEDIVIMNKDETLENIQNKFDITNQAVKNYHSHLETFEIAKETKNFLETFVNNKILSHHKEIKKILDDISFNVTLLNLHNQSEIFKRAYNYEMIESKLKETKDSFKNSYFDKMAKDLKAYGTITKKYSENLNKEKTILSNKNLRNRTLSEDGSRIVDLKLDKTFKLLRESSQSIKQYIETINIFSNFENKINNYINKINEQYEASIILINEQKFTDDINKVLNNNLNELKNLSISYYGNVKLNYDNIKNYIEKSIIENDDLIENSMKATYEVINDEYQKIKNNYISINNITNEEKSELNNFQIYDKINDNYYHALITINGFLLDNEFNFEIINDDEGVPKLIGKSVNKNRPKSFTVDFSTKIGKCKSNGKQMIINLNHISSNINISIDGSSTVTKIIKKYDFDEYYIDNKYYYEKEKPKTIIIDNIPTTKIFCISTLQPIEDRFLKDIIGSKTKNITEII